MDDEIPESLHNKMPKWLTIFYVLLIIGGIWAFIAYWNGSHGWLDRGYWQQLQKAAHTTFPFEQQEPYLQAGGK